MFVTSCKPVCIYIYIYVYHLPTSPPFILKGEVFLFEDNSEDDDLKNRIIKYK